MSEEERIQQLKNEQNRNVIIPLILSVLLVAGMIFVLIHFGIKDPTVILRMKDLAVILPLFVFFLLNFAALILLVAAGEAVKKANAAMNGAMNTANQKIADATPVINQMIREAAEPMIRSRSALAGVASVLNHLFGK